MPVTVPRPTKSPGCSARRPSRRAGSTRCRTATRPGWRSRSACSTGTPSQPRPRRTRPTGWRRARSRAAAARRPRNRAIRRTPVERVRHVQPERVGRRVRGPQLRAEPERIAGRRLLARPQLRGHVREQQPGRDHRGARRAAHRAEQFGLGDRAVVVQVERVAARRVSLREVGPRPPRRHRQVPPQLCLRHAQPLVGEGDLRRAPEHRGLPLRARVVIVREGGDDRPHVRGLRHRVHRPRQRQQRPRGPARGLITRSREGELRAEGVVRGVAPRQLGADRLARRRRLEHRPVLDVVGRRSGLGPEPVLGLRQEPEVVVAVDHRVAVADPDLHVHDLLRRVPQLAHPPQTELRLVPQRGGGRPAGVPRGQQRAARPRSSPCSRTSRTRRPRRTSRQRRSPVRRSW